MEVVKEVVGRWLVVSSDTMVSVVACFQVGREWRTFLSSWNVTKHIHYRRSISVRQYHCCLLSSPVLLPLWPLRRYSNVLLFELLSCQRGCRLIGVMNACDDKLSLRTHMHSLVTFTFTFVLIHRHVILLQSQLLSFQNKASWRLVWPVCSASVMSLGLKKFRLRLITQVHADRSSNRLRFKLKPEKFNIATGEYKVTKCKVQPWNLALCYLARVLQLATVCSWESTPINDLQQTFFSLGTKLSPLLDPEHSRLSGFFGSSLNLGQWVGFALRHAMHCKDNTSYDTLWPNTGAYCCLRRFFFRTWWLAPRILHKSVTNPHPEVKSRLNTHRAPWHTEQRH